MSGHSKWSKIKHKKALTDSKKSKEFARVVHIIKVAVRQSGGDANSPAVRAAIEKARAVNMPRENIDRAVKSAQTLEVDSTEEVLYETYGPGGVAMIIESLTDNRNRSAAEIKHTLLEHGLSLASPGAARWAFEKKDFEFIPKQKINLAEDDRKKLSLVCESLDELDHVQAIYTNEEARKAP